MSTLRKSLIPSNPPNVSEGQALNVFNAIETLHGFADNMIGFLEYTQVRPAENWPLTPREVTKYWNGGILSWFTFLFDYYHPPFNSDAPSRWDTINYVSCVFTFFIKANMDLVSNTPGAGRLATRLWLVTDYDFVRSKYSLSAGWWDPAMYMLCPYSINDRPLTRKPNLGAELYSVEGVSNKSMIHLILTRMDNTTSVYNDQDVQQYTRLVGFLIEFEEGEVPFKRIARVLSRKAAHLSANINPKHEVHHLHLACLSYFEHISLILNDARSIEVIVTAIRSGLLWAFVKFSDVFTKMKLPENKRLQHVTDYGVDAAIDLIADIIPRYMMYGSVISAIEDELEDIEDGHVADTIVNTRWQKFKRLFEMNKAILDTKTPRVVYCDNIKHDVNNNSGKTFECTGCGYFRYCSKKCQKEDWVDRHRYNRDCRKDGRQPLHNRDHLSICRFVIMTIKLQWKLVQERARRDYPDVPLSQLEVLYDFAKLPPDWHLGTLESDRAATKAAEHVPNATVVQCRIILGGYVWTITAAGDINGVENKSWITRKPQPISRYPQ